MNYQNLSPIKKQVTLSSDKEIGINLQHTPKQPKLTIQAKNLLQ